MKVKFLLLIALLPVAVFRRFRKLIAENNPAVNRFFALNFLLNV